MREYIFVAASLIWSQTVNADNSSLIVPRSKSKCMALSEDIFKLWSGYGCFNYTPESRFAPGFYDFLKQQTRNKYVANSSEYFPYVQLEKTTIYFDYTDEDMSKLIETIFNDQSYYVKWRNCAEEAVKCCQTVLKYSNENDNSKCKAIWDGWGCFPDTDFNEYAQIPCPNYIYSSYGPPCTHYSTKYCSPTRKWNSTSYDSCTVIEEGTLIHEYYGILLLISIAVSIPATIIFTSYYKLRVTRVKLHNNLIISIIIRNVFLLLSIWYIIFDNVRTTDIEMTVQYQNGFLCKFIIFFAELSTNWMFGAMVLDAFYMYQILVKTFDSNPTMKYYYAVIGVLCITATTIWGVMKYLSNYGACWMITNDYETWINLTLRGGMLLFNTLLLICVMRVVIEKLQNHTNSVKSASKATLVLTPLFGIQFFLTSYHLPSTSCLIKETYYFIGYTVDGLLGFIVSLLYCFLNREVQILLMSSIRDIRTSCHIRARRYDQSRNHSTDTLNTYRMRQNISGTLMTPAESYHSLALKTIHINANKACINNCNYCECEQSRLRQTIE